MSEPRDVIGDSPKRREDARFLVGRGRYLDDLAFPDLAHAVMVRSPHAHARIRGFDAAAARAAPGVLAVLTGAEAAAAGLTDFRPVTEANIQTGEPFAFMPQPVLAGDVVRHVGEPVAMVVAGTRDEALDAAELVEVDYEPLPAVTTPAAAAAPGAPLLSPAVPGNCCMDWRIGDGGAVDAALARAAHVVTLSLHHHRVVTNPMEPRGAVGTWDAAAGRYLLHASTQNVHVVRDHVARAIGTTPDKVRLIAPDVGGGFGVKNFAYSEHALVLWAARRLGRPVKWIATRSEAFLSDQQARDHYVDATLALAADGSFLALRVTSAANIGAYLTGAAGAVQTGQYVFLPGTVYRIPAIELHVTAQLTNTTPIGVTRGPGFAEMNNLVERLIDAAARRHGFDRIELRRRNMVPAAPMTNALGFSVDSGKFAENLERALAAADVAGFEARRQDAAARGRCRGLGIVNHLKGNAGLPHENAEVRFEPDGTVSLIMGTQTIGQGHETTFPQILADRLGLPNARIILRQGDTDLIRMGGGHGSSRATVMGGTAIHNASQEIVAKGIRLAAERLEAAEADIEFRDGRFAIAGTDRSIGLLELAAVAREAGAPLDTYHHWTRTAMSYPTGAHVAEIEIDPETGRVSVERYVAVEDYGVIVNPMVVTGQAHGAIAQGIGQAVLETTIYDPDSGQLLSGSFMDYAMPRASDLPDFELAYNGTPCLTNPIGVKGSGECGAIAAVPVIASAVVDALMPLGVTDFDGPATPARVWAAIAAARR